MSSSVPARPRLPGLPSLTLRTGLLLVLAALSLAFLGALRFLAAEAPGQELRLDTVGRLAEQGAVDQAVFLDEDARIVGTTRDGKAFWVAYPESDSATVLLLEQLTDGGARVSVDSQPVEGAVRLVATGLLPLLILAALLGLMVTGQGGGAAQVRGFGTLARRGRGVAAPPDTRFEHVAGADDAVAELREVVDHLRDPERFHRLGAAAPKGVLLFGPPGTGKTLIARATAGEAGVPFFSVAGAEFVESLVGVGAARVRDLFEHVRRAAPAILFIDEIDAAGRRRGSGSGGGSDEREQTLNQLLVEMDGFSASTGVVVMAATNRPDILDPALLRPGRFDRHVTVEPPDVAGRQRILALHAAGRPLAGDVDLAQLARRTPGFTGADLANVVNEAALLAVRAGRHEIGPRELAEATDRVVGGTGGRSASASGALARRKAVHEAGRALAAAVLGHEVHRVSLLGRARTPDVAGENDQDTRDDLMARLVVGQAGRAAEQLVLASTSTRGETDLQTATGLARDMVTRYGMSPELGPMYLAGVTTDPYLGGPAAPDGLSDTMRQRVEHATARFLEQAFDEATALLCEHREVLDRLCDLLVRYESLEGAELDRVLSPARDTRSHTGVGGDPLHERT